MPLNLNDLDDAEKFQEHFVKPLVDAVRTEVQTQLKPLTTTVYATRTRVAKLEGKWNKALVGFAAATIAIGLGLDWLRKKLGLLSVLLLVVFLVGCASVPVTKPPSVKHPFTSMSQALGEIDSLMSLVTVLSVALFGVGVVLMFYLKTSLGPALMAGGIATLVLSIFVKSMLWFVPWIAGGMVAVGLIAFAIDVHKRGFHAALHDVEHLVHIR